MFPSVMTANNEVPISLGLRAGGAPLLWKRVLDDAFPLISQLVPPGTRVLEIGYGDGLLSCHLCSRFGWNLTGIDIDEKAATAARKNAERFGVTHLTDFRCCVRTLATENAEPYGAVFVKTVLYTAKEPGEYGEWLDWIASVLEPGGILINLESARSNLLTRLYRIVRRRSYRNLCLYTSKIESLHEERFDILFRRYYGGTSQFFVGWPPAFHAAQRLEETLVPRTPDNCFIASVICRARTAPRDL